MACMRVEPYAHMTTFRDLCASLPRLSCTRQVYTNRILCQASFLSLTANPQKMLQVDAGCKAVAVYHCIYLCGWEQDRGLLAPDPEAAWSMTLLSVIKQQGSLCCAPLGRATPVYPES